MTRSTRHRRPGRHRFTAHRETPSVGSQALPRSFVLSWGDLGSGALRAALPVAIWGMGAAIYAASKRDGRGLAMEGALVSHDFSIQYVAENNARATPLFFTVISLWAALAGSILLWTLVLAGATAYVAWRGTRELPRLGTTALAVLLGVGIVAGSWWSYAVLGWGGYWAWDPVENAAIMPWLVATAYLHSVMVEEKRRLLRSWNLSLVIATFALTILGTFLTRSGVVNSVHAFTQSAIGPLLLGYLVAIIVLSVGLLLWRLPTMRDAGAVGAPLSREAIFLFQNVIFVAATLTVLLGTLYPLIAEAISGD